MRWLGWVRLAYQGMSLLDFASSPFCSAYPRRLPPSANAGRRPAAPAPAAGRAMVRAAVNVRAREWRAKTIVCYGGRVV